MDEQLDALLRGRRFKKAVLDCFDAIREKYGMKQIEIEAIAFLSTKPDSTSCEMCRVMNLNKGQLSQAMDSLKEKGFVAAQTDDEDKRKICYTMSEKGEAVAQEITAVKKSMMRKLFDGFSGDEMQMFRNMVFRICKNIETMSDEQGRPAESAEKSGRA